MKKISWTLMFTCALMALGLLFSGCDLFNLLKDDDTPSSGSKTPGNDQSNDQGNDQTEDQGGGSPIEITGFPITSPSSSSGHALLLKSDGTVWATGYNQYGQFGNGTTIDTNPFTTTTFTKVADHVVSLGDTKSVGDSFIIKDDGSLWAAGRNYYGTHASNTSAFEKEFDSGVKAFSVNGGIYVLKEDGSLWVRGIGTYGNNNGQLGLGHKNDVSSWTPVPGLSGVVAIARSRSFGLVLKSDGTVLGVGQNYYGALGQGGPDGMNYAEITAFAPIFKDDTKAKAIAVGDSDHSLILRNDGTLLVAGSSANGKLGNGKSSSSASNAETTFTEIDIEGITGVITAISAGNNHSVILTSDGNVWAAGSNANGQLGKPQANPATSSTFIKIASGVTQISAQGDQTFILEDGTLQVTGYVNTGILGEARKPVYGFTEITLPELPE